MPIAALEKTKVLIPTFNDTLEAVSYQDSQLSKHFEGKLPIDPTLTRQLVSFQDNKNKPVYRWYKFKEAFSASLVDYLFQRYNISSGRILDPFAGSGTALFVATALGMDADGIELLPIGNEIIKARKICFHKELKKSDIAVLKTWLEKRPWEKYKVSYQLPILKITDGAYPKETLQAIEKYMSALQNEKARVQHILRFALLCILESVSFTRKDGQYLRWDYRSGRRPGENTFNKGKILNFREAITMKIKEILEDIQENNHQFELPFSTQEKQRGVVNLYEGSCLDIMPKLSSDTYETIITSPPYCNRYDYTRTYALELALLGIGEKELIKLRQEMLSCTVENREKDLLAINSGWDKAVSAADNQELLQTVLKHLEIQKEKKLLNNNGIPRMVRGYFYEMACMVADFYRVLKPNGLLFMVNDNVRYAGASVSVDIILSQIAEQVGFHVENILVLPKGKGNSSQQMGQHGREPLRKCVYVWRKV